MSLLFCSEQPWLEVLFPEHTVWGSFISTGEPVMTEALSTLSMASSSPVRYWSYWSYNYNIYLYLCSYDGIHSCSVKRLLTCNFMWKQYYRQTVNWTYDSKVRFGIWICDFGVSKFVTVTLPWHDERANQQEISQIRPYMITAPPHLICSCPHPTFLDLS